MSSSSERDDLQCYLSGHKNNRSGKRAMVSPPHEIDWTKLMESAGGDDDQAIEINYGDSSDDADINMFLKTPTTKHDRPKNKPEHSRDKDTSKSTPSRRKSIGGDPNLHVVSDLDISQTSELLSSSSTISDPTPQDNVIRVPGLGIDSNDDYSIDSSERSGLPVTNVRNASEMSLSTSEYASDGLTLSTKLKQTSTQNHFQSRETVSFKNEDDLTPSVELTETVDSISESVSLSQEPMGIKHNVFSIDQLDSSHSETATVRDQIYPEDEEEFSEDQSLSELLGRAHTLNIHTVDELLVDSPSESSGGDRNKQPLKAVSKQPRGHRVDSSNTNSCASKSTKLPSQGAPESQKTNTGVQVRDVSPSASRTSFKFSAAKPVVDGTKFNNEIRPNNDDVSTHKEEYSYSVDDDFESLIIADTDGTELSDSIGTRTETEQVDVENSYSETVKSDRGSEYQYSSFSDDKVTMTEKSESSQSYSQVSSHHSSKDNLPSTKSIRRGHQDASAQTPTYVHISSIQQPPITRLWSVPDRDGLPPTPLLPQCQVMSGNTLEAMTSYSPGSIVLNDMIRNQLVLIRQSIASTNRQVANICDSTNASYHYTTLEDTKAYIERNRPKVLTMKEAKKSFKKN